MTRNIAKLWGRRQLACQSLAVYDKGSVYYTNGTRLVTVRQLGCGPDRMPTQVGLQAHATRVEMASARQQALRKRIFLSPPPHPRVVSLTPALRSRRLVSSCGQGSRTSNCTPGLRTRGLRRIFADQA